MMPMSPRAAGCDNCAGHRYNGQPDPNLVGQALSFIRRRPIDIEPRKRWLGHRSGAVNNALEPGRALCYLTDPGWGDQLLDAKRSGQPLSDELVEAAAALINGWMPDFHGTIVYVPTLDPSRTLVENFAKRLAKRMHVQVSDCLVKLRPNAPQKLMENSAQQLHNVDEVFGIRGRAPTSPVLLIDDIVGSRWTLAVLGDLLLSSGTGPVYPFAVGKIKG